MMEKVFEIEGMECTYPDERERLVLRIEHLEVERGETVFLVGPSGIGKSTILEALGMMNNTVRRCEVFRYMGMDMSQWWSRGDSEQSAFRRKEFSFIFQSNNLMNNFSAWENVKSTALFQGMSNRDAERRKREIFEAIDIVDERAWDAPVSTLSGGQRQRLAFARAIMPSFSVLFGDEPTGNLDPATADTLMCRLKKILKQKEGATAVIVSHDMALASRYADRIVRFQRRFYTYNGMDVPYGLIDESSIYRRTKEELWGGCDGRTYGNEEIGAVLTKGIASQEREEVVE